MNRVVLGVAALVALLFLAFGAASYLGFVGTDKEEANPLDGVTVIDWPSSDSDDAGWWLSENPPPTPPPPLEEFSLDSDVLFETNSSTLNDGATDELSVIVEALLERSTVVAEIHGHTDNVGDPQYNLGLSQQRAASVADFLTGVGIEQHRLEIYGRGSTDPISSNDTEAGRSQNRRVEIQIRERR